MLSCGVLHAQISPIGDLQTVGNGTTEAVVVEIPDMMVTVSYSRRVIVQSCHEVLVIGVLHTAAL